MSNNTNLVFYLTHADRLWEIFERFSLKAQLLPSRLSSSMTHSKTRSHSYEILIKLSTWEEESFIPVCTHHDGWTKDTGVCNCSGRNARMSDLPSKCCSGLLQVNAFKMHIKLCKTHLHMHWASKATAEDVSLPLTTNTAFIHTSHAKHHKNSGQQSARCVRTALRQDDSRITAFSW